jgi:hypothetical protein
MGHGDLLQFSTSVFFPEHGAPPNWGLEQVLVLLLVALPQLELHEPHLVHPVHFPSIGQLYVLQAMVSDNLKLSHFFPVVLGS